MRKIWAIAWKDTYSVFTDSSLLLIMIAAPLLISTIIGLVFGGGGGGGVSLSDIEVVVVNQDEGVDQGDGTITNNGTTLVNILSAADDGGDGNNAPCPLVDEGSSGDPGADDSLTPQTSLADLFNVTVIDDAAQARAGVDDGDYAAAVLIPADFSARMAPQIGPGGGGGDDAQSVLEVYGSSGREISASVVATVVQGITNQIMTGNIAITATVNTAIARNPAAAQQLGGEEAGTYFNCAFSDALNTINLGTLGVAEDDGNELTALASVLVTFGAAQAVFFALFTGQFGVIDIIEERRQGTLQRLLVSPTPRNHILGGKLTGAFVTVVFQIVVLMIALLLVAAILDGQLQMIWGTNLPGLIVVVLAIGVAVIGVGAILAGIAKTPEQLNAFGSIVNIVLAVGGGAFGFAVPSPIRELSLIYWGRDALETLAAGNSDILLNVAVLLVQGAIFFVVGVFLFNRRADI